MGADFDGDDFAVHGAGQNRSTSVRKTWEGETHAFISGEATRVSKKYREQASLCVCVCVCVCVCIFIYTSIIHMCLIFPGPVSYV